MAMTKQHHPPFHFHGLIRVQDDLPHSIAAVINALAPSPATPYYPPIFLTPSPSPAPLPSPAASHSSVPKAAIIGGSVAGAVVALAVTATVISTVAGKVGLSCVLAPLLKILTSPFSGAVCSGPCAKLYTLFCNLLGRNCKKNGSDKTSGGPCAKLISFCSNLQWQNRKKDGSHDKPSNDPTEGDSDVKLFIDVLGGQYSPEAVAQRAKTTAQNSDEERMSVQSFLSTQVSEFTERLEKQKAMIMQTLENSSPLQDVIKAHGDQLPAMSAQSLLTTQASEFAEEELKKQKALIMQPLHENVMKAQEYFESLYSATSNASDELKALKSSACAYLDEVGKLTHASAEQMGKAIAIEVGAEQIHTSSILATEYAAEMKRLQKLTNEPFILDEEVLLNRVQPKISSLGDEEAYHNEEVSNQHMHTNYADGLRDQGSEPIVETLSDANKIREEMGAMVLDQYSGTDQQYLSSVALVPTTSIADAQNTSLQSEAGPIVPVPTKAITRVPAKMTIGSATAKLKPRWQGGTLKAKRPTNLGHVSCSCELSALKVHFFTSCRSGGSYGSPQPSHAGDDVKYYQNHNFIEMHELDADTNNKKGEVSSYYNSSLASHPNISYGGNKHVGVLTSSSAPITHHYIANAQYHQPTTNSSPSQQMATPSFSLSTSTVLSNSHPQSDYGNPFDGVL
ncbi:hypothetical protein GOP47_0012286 [Adiantum capillus-veneris]|uniref:Uncharacterized protein n=1 Tax=Adiantum capillus-veneris TaxID=13818 RepID=A0A9D4UQE4_ADICA|nr:hypothetical protein GOP47_0012286 [Adiantum capillus-veneris]